MKRKCLAVGIILLFIAITVNPITGISNNRDDTTPPVTTISFDPPVPDGDNGWYVSNVTVTLNATDNESGVWRTFCSLSPGGNYTEPILVSQDGIYYITFYSIDYAGNVEAMKSATIKIDQTRPFILLTYTVEGNVLRGWEITFNAAASDEMSGMNRVEFYYNDAHQGTIFGPGPTYELIYFGPQITVRGVIRHREITDESVRFYAIIVKIKNHWDTWESSKRWAIAYDQAGNYIDDFIENHCLPAFVESGFYVFQDVMLPNNYTGYIGRFFICATFTQMDIHYPR